MYPKAFSSALGRLQVGLAVVACAASGLAMTPDSALAQAIMEDGRLVVPERRTLQWAAGDGNRELIESTYARIRRLTGNTPGSWSY